MHIIGENEKIIKNLNLIGREREHRGSRGIHSVDAKQRLHSYFYLHF